MKAEGAGAVPLQRVADRVEGQVRSHRWLADLERAWLEAFGREGALDDAGGGRPPTMPPVTPLPSTGDAGAARPVARVDDLSVESMQPERGDDRAPLDAPPELVLTAAAASPASATAQPGTGLEERNALEGSPLLGTTRQSGIATAAPAGAQAAGLPMGLDAVGVPPSVRVAQAGSAVGPRLPADREPTPHLPALPSHPARQFARRLLQVSGEQALQANLRDATVTPEQQPVVARELFQQLNTAGTPLRRLYINGQRFDDGQARPASYESTDQE